MSTVFVYRLYDRAGSLLYIGCTNNVPRRVDQHIRKGTGGGDAIADYSSEEYPTRQAGLAAEARAILEEQPPVNVQSKLRRGVALEKVGDPEGAWPMVVAWRVAQRMLATETSVPELAQACGLPASRLSRALVQGNFRLNDLVMVARELGVSLLDLLADEVAA